MNEITDFLTSPNSRSRRKGREELYFSSQYTKFYRLPKSFKASVLAKLDATGFSAESAENIAKMDRMDIQAVDYVFNMLMAINPSGPWPEPLLAKALLFKFFEARAIDLGNWHQGWAAKAIKQDGSINWCEYGSTLLRSSILYS